MSSYTTTQLGPIYVLARILSADFAQTPPGLADALSITKLMADTRIDFKLLCAR
jgi:hypothetical protein